MSLTKVFIVTKILKLYLYSFVPYTKFSLSTAFSISLILLGSFLVSSVNVFSGIVYLIVNFWVLGFKTFKTSTCFSFLYFFFHDSSIVFICFPNALSSREYANLACSIILL